MFSLVFLVLLGKNLKNLRKYFCESPFW